MNILSLFSKPKPTDPLEENVTTLFEELQLAGKYHRPSILLAAYRSKIVLSDTQNSLKSKLRTIKQSVSNVTITNENWDVPLLISRRSDRAEKVFFVSGLKNGGGPGGKNAYRALNIRRELLVDFHIRVVFWLTVSEANTLPREAGDFWSFRHRMIELFD